MPAGMIYVAVQGSVDPNTIVNQVGQAAAAAGLTQGPWNAATVIVPTEVTPAYDVPANATPTDAQQAIALRIGNDALNAAQRATLAAQAGMQANGTALYGSSGPFLGVLISTSPPSPAPASVAITAFKQVLLGTGNFGGVSNRVGTALNAFTATAAPWGQTPMGDRGVPPNPAYVETGAGASSDSSGTILGLMAVAALAYVASRGTAKKPAMAGVRAKKGLGVSFNREHLTFQEWIRAAGVPSSTKGVHAAWARGEDPSEWRAEVQYAATQPGRRRASLGAMTRHEYDQMLRERLVWLSNPGNVRRAYPGEAESWYREYTRDTSAAIRKELRERGARP